MNLRFFFFFCLPTENERCKSTSGNGNRESTILFSSIVDKNRILNSHITFIKHVETLVISVRKVGLERRLTISTCKLNRIFFFLNYVNSNIEIPDVSHITLSKTMLETFAMLEFRQYFQYFFHQTFIFATHFSPPSIATSLNRFSKSETIFEIVSTRLQQKKI